MAENVSGSIRYAVIDAFTDHPFKGNPAAVCLLEEEKETEWMQTVAAEFNLPVTAFVRRRENTHQNGNALDNDAEEFELRWFTPVTEVNLCGHATLASAHFLFSSSLVKCNLVLFHTRSGVLTALKIEVFNREGKSFERETERFAIELKFPQISVLGCDSSDIPLLSNSLKGLEVQCVKKTTHNDLFIELASGEQVESLQPQLDEIHKCSGRGVIVTGLAPPQSGFDFYSRVFCPKIGINEDHVTGSVHCALGPYWATKLGKTHLVAYQASKRGGKLVLQVVDDEKCVLLQGEAVKIMSGVLTA